jgi:hypothetical protein
MIKVFWILTIYLSVGDLHGWRSQSGPTFTSEAACHKRALQLQVGDEAEAKAPDRRNHPKMYLCEKQMVVVTPGIRNR